MYTLKDLFNHHEKAIKVILSCKNLEHLQVARSFCMRVMEVHMKCALNQNSFSKPAYVRLINESEELMNEALRDQKYFLRGDLKRTYDFKSKKKNQDRNKNL